MTASNNSPDEYKDHQEMWESFVKLITYAGAAVAVALILMAIFLL